MLKRIGASLSPRHAWVSAVLLASALASLPANASTQFSLLAGMSVKSGAANPQASTLSPLVGAEITAGLGEYLQVGPFFENNFLSYDNGVSGSLRFFGGVGRIGFGALTGFFLDGKIGLTQTSATNLSTDTSLGIGAGLGYRFEATPVVTVAPRLGFRYLPAYGMTQSMLDFSVLLTFGF